MSDPFYGDPTDPRLVLAAAGDGTWPMTDPDGPCRTWPLAPGCGCLPLDRYAWNELHLNAVEDATDLLWRLTAGRYGLCRTTVRPGNPLCAMTVPVGCSPVGGPGYLTVTGQLPPLDRVRACCRCAQVREVTLPGPVFTDPLGAAQYSIDVWVDGVQLPTSAYRVVGGDRLVRVDGRSWPGCQHDERPMTPPDGTPPDALLTAGTFGVVYWRGRPVPIGGRRSVAVLACEMWRAATGDPRCRIPDRVTEVAREGVTYKMIDRQEFLAKGRIGITEIDTWLGSVNPRGRRSPPAVFSVDLAPMVSEPTSSAYPGEAPL